MTEKSVIDWMYTILLFLKIFIVIIDGVMVSSVFLFYF